MKHKQYLALLRGINVGGKNIIKMTELKLCFEKLGFTDVATYIQSGNVMFRVSNAGRDLEQKIEKALSKTFAYQSRVVVMPHEHLKNIVEQAPRGFGQKPTSYRYDVIFLKQPVTVKEAIAVFKTREGVDAVHGGKHALYFSRLISKSAQSYLSRVIKEPLYQDMTIRNWNTTSKVLSLMDQRLAES